MKKLTIKTLSQMAAVLPELTESEQERILGGTDCEYCGNTHNAGDYCISGSYTYTYNEMLFMIDYKTWVGGNVEGYGYVEAGAITGHYYSGVYTEEEMIQLMFRSDWNGGWVNGEYLDGDHTVTGLYTLDEAASMLQRGEWNGGWVDGAGYVGPDVTGFVGSGVTGFVNDHNCSEVFDPNCSECVATGYTWEQMERMVDDGTWTGGVVGGHGYVGEVTVVKGFVSGNYEDGGEPVNPWDCIEQMTSGIDIVDYLTEGSIPGLAKVGGTLNIMDNAYKTLDLYQDANTTPLDWCMHMQNVLYAFGGPLVLAVELAWKGIDYATQEFQEKVKGGLIKTENSLGREGNYSFYSW